MDTKPWYASKGIWGGIISVVALIVGIFGVEGLTPEVQSAIVDNLVVVASGVGTLIGTVLGIYGRLKATSAIGK